MPDWLAQHWLLHLPSWAYITWVVGILPAWFVLYGVDAALKGGSGGRHWLWFPIQCAYEEFRSWYAPGARQRRIDHIRKHISLPVREGYMAGRTRAWAYSELRKYELVGQSAEKRDRIFLRCYNDILPDRFNLFWYVAVAALWPVIVIFILASNSVAIVWNLLRQGWKRFFARASS